MMTNVKVFAIILCKGVSSHSSLELLWMDFNVLTAFKKLYCVG